MSNGALIGAFVYFSDQPQSSLSLDCGQGCVPIPSIGRARLNNTLRPAGEILVEAAHSHPLLEALSAVLRLAPRGRLLLRDLLVEIGNSGPEARQINSNREQMPAAPDRPRAASLHARPRQDDVAWTALRDALRQHLDAGTITRPELAKALGIKRNSLSGHLGRRVPGGAVQAQVRRWLEKTAAANNAAAASPTTMLSRQEQDRLLGYLSSGGNRRELKEQFGADRDTLERAAAGETLPQRSSLSCAQD